MNYQVMTEYQMQEVNKRGYAEKVYTPNYDELIAKSSCKEEAAKWEECKAKNSTFAFNMVYSTKQKCGHWEVFQQPMNEYYPLEKVIGFAEEIAKERVCTCCTLNQLNPIK